MKLNNVLLGISMTLLCQTSWTQSIQRVTCDGDLVKLDSMLQTTDINVKNNTESNLLHMATFCRQDKVFDLLMERGIQVDEKNKFGDTPLLYAVQFRKVKMVQALLDKGADPNAENNEQQTPLFRAVRSDNAEIFDLLIAAGADVNQGLSPLHRAVQNENLDFIRRLINENTDVDMLNDRGNTPLAIALRQGSGEIAEFLISKGASKEKVRTFDLRGDFLGQTKPGLEARMFAPNFISTEDFNHTPSFSPNGKEFYFTTESRILHGGTIMVSKQKRGKWTQPKPAYIDGTDREIDPFISPDGKTLYYSSNRKINPSDSTPGNIDLWMVKRKGKGWGEPIHLGDAVNSEHAEWFPTVSEKGNLFFSTGPGRSSNIVYSEFKDGKYQEPISLGDSVNSEQRDYDPIIAPDESYVIWSSNRPGGFGSVDLYVSFKKADGSWTKAKNLGESVNTSTIEFAPRLSLDGKYLFFNRQGDIWWISSEVIENLR